MSTLYIFQYMYVPSLKYHAYEQMKWKKIFNGEGKQIYVKTVKLEYSNSIGN